MTAYEFIKENNISVCYAATEALEAFEGPIDDYFDTHPRGAAAFLWCIKYANEAIKHLITTERVDRSAMGTPGAALKYAAEYLTQERLDWCKERFYDLASSLALNHTRKMCVVQGSVRIQDRCF